MAIINHHSKNGWQCVSDPESMHGEQNFVNQSYIFFRCTKIILLSSLLFKQTLIIMRKNELEKLEKNEQMTHI
ncbi:hypothetical protein DERP_004057 [Dermatophagoides pteronyssinus]|uniref:Uncharacterized protein n=1 Tax=Dermatophagoides pteronyssinus TaxID=6956 RepID=A0ABQ8J823_DERPT|nr:hypothetical protein DERP_004057 [Dermatophagoides pteronyssinus]